MVRVLVEVVQRRGVAAEALLGGSATSFLSEPTDRRLSFDAYQALIARGIELTSEPALGIQCGLLASESSFGLMAPLVSHAPNLRHALALVAQFGGLISEEVRIELGERVGTAQLRCKLPAQLGRSVVELIVAGLVRTLRAFGCLDTELHAVCFEHRRPEYYPAYTAAFGGAERFSQRFTGLEFATRALDRPHMHWQPELQAVMRAHAERALSQLARPRTCTERVRALLASRRDYAAPEMVWVARELRLSIRSLRRRLDEEGTSYSELVQAALHDAACSLLRNPDLTLQAVAHALGFADSAGFHRAFKRWSGMTPAEYRTASIARPLLGLERDA